MAIGNMLKKFGKVRPCGFRVMRADKQRDRQKIDEQTNVYSLQYFTPLPGATYEVQLR